MDLDLCGFIIFMFLVRIMNSFRVRLEFFRIYDIYLMLGLLLNLWWIKFCCLEFDMIVMNEYNWERLIEVFLFDLRKNYICMGYIY